KVLDGRVTDVKAEHGIHNVALAIDGDGRGVVLPVLEDRSLVARFDDQNQYFEIELAPGANPQELLQRVVRGGAALSRFELIQPSLHQIFLDRVGAQGVEPGMSGHG
ncbi:MAG: DUF4162 domain-containing protein, partial [Gemmatimonadota bacterium]|nr:DUF4162 domain-containing protein [Gemmatimonadota bacterium]